MRTFVASLLLGLGALGLTAATPTQARASWLSEALNNSSFSINIGGNPYAAPYGPAVAPYPYPTTNVYSPAVIPAPTCGPVVTQTPIYVPVPVYRPIPTPVYRPVPAPIYRPTPVPSNAYYGPNPWRNDNPWNNSRDWRR